MLQKEKSTNVHKKRKNENIENKVFKNAFFFLMSRGSLNPKSRFLCQKVRSVPWLRTDRQKHTKVTTVHFRVSGVFPSTYNQGSAQLHLLSLLDIHSPGLFHTKCRQNTSNQITNNTNYVGICFLLHKQLWPW